LPELPVQRCHPGQIRYFTGMGMSIAGGAYVLHQSGRGS
jgi:hypothetical protein